MKMVDVFENDDKTVEHQLYNQCMVEVKENQNQKSM